METGTSAENYLGRYVREVYDAFAKQRVASIEDEWFLAYDAFKGEYSASNLEKWKALEGYDWRSKAFIRAARRKTISAVAQINDIYFQGGVLPFNLKPSEDAKLIQGMTLPPEVAQFRCDNMRSTINADLARAKYERSLMASNLELGIYGMSVHMCPVVKPWVARTYVTEIPGMARALNAVGLLPPEVLMRYTRQVPRDIRLEIAVPVHINLWDYFWDFEAPDHQSGIANIHRVMMDPGMVRRLEEMPGYDKIAINALLSVPIKPSTSTRSKNSEAPSKTDLQSYNRTIEVVNFWGRVPKRYLSGREDLMATIDTDGREVEINAVFAYAPGDSSGGVEIRKASPNKNPLQRRPFNVAFWETIPHETVGCGVPENMQDSTMAQNGAWRAFMDNKALAGNLMLFWKSSGFKPGQDMNPRPGGQYELEESVRNVRDVYDWISPPDIGAGLMEMFQVAERLGDIESANPSMLQGEMSRNMPDTAYQSHQLVEAANKVIGQVIKNIDEGHIEPDIEAMYHYNMEVNQREDIKGAFDCQATGFSGYNDRILTGNAILNALSFGLSNQFTQAYMKVPEHLKEIYKAKSLDPDNFLKSQDQVDQEAAQKMMAMAQLQAPPGVGGMEGSGNPPVEESALPPGAPPGGMMGGGYGG
jgi:hypothetical protein